MIGARRQQRVVAWQVYDFTLKQYYAGEVGPGIPAWSPFKRDAYRCTTADEAEGLVVLVPPGHERRVLEVRAQSY